ncbi:BMP family ABC transporter substrate-binding protein [Sneathiella chinensis]|uniref:BMP family ABC transporter substrate-binding protein n=1 Tax=Sneathiella chinensis TaxID=349750 RepID=A0ABQ5U354_9PROT|nr:BMP family ABC transporter substrate-binding protein [Sneathiella chinensis]GLQ06080.1 BMP family ABC transporter substrate-binding protein [Sneathiella chinensis]
MKRRFFLKSLLGTLSAAALALTAAQASAEDKLKVGFVYVGPISDYGWSYQHDQGRLGLEKALGDKIETTYVENVKEGADAERVIRQLASSGHNLIFSTSFGFMNATLKVAKKFPNVKFEHATGYKTADNLSIYAGRYYEGRYIMGQIAGKLTKTNKIGYVASFPIPEVVRGINAFIIGARSVNPEATITPVWVNTWYDPGKEGDAAKALIDQGVDILTQHTDSPAPLQVAEERGIFAFGQASNMIAFAPNAQLTGIEDNWVPYYVKRTQEVLDGTWKTGEVWDGLSTGMVKMSDYTNMPEEIAEMARKTEAAIAKGEINPFTGPLRKQDGSIAVEEGKTIPDAELAGMNYYVEGVIGSLPK